MRRPSWCCGSFLKINDKLNYEYDIGNHFFNILHYHNIFVYIHVKKNCNAIPGQSWLDPEGSRQHLKVVSCQPYSPVVFTPKKIFLELISVCG
jgi:hypothetical protein